ncbi:MAG: sigma-70 family RNA polymerase sigma factor [Phycisphaeraceae bacterium]|nr:sigma-70 family RNA polymerase sigma factor [Phycisphaeraceae bacterium]
MPPPKPLQFDAVEPHKQGGDRARPQTHRSAERTEEELVRAIQGGDQEAWRDLARRVLPRLYALCYRMMGRREDAADAAQAAMLRLLQVIGQYDGRSRFSTWAYRVTTNICISRLRSAKVRRTASLDGGRGPDPGAGSGRTMEPQGREPDPGSSVEHSDAAARLVRAMRTLEPEQRAILILRDGQDLAYDRIAEVLGIGIGTVKSRLFRARGALREAMEGMGYSPEASRGRDPGSGAAETEADGK